MIVAIAFLILGLLMVTPAGARTVSRLNQDQKDNPTLLNGGPGFKPTSVRVIRILGVVLLVAGVAILIADAA